MQDASDRQHGGILVYIIVGVVLAALLGGAIYASKHQGRVASQTDTAATNNQKTEDTSTENPVQDTAKDDDSHETSPQSNGTGQTTTPQSSSPAPSASVPSTGPSHIASTGPEDVLLPGVGLAMVAAGLVALRRSQSAVRIQALKQ